MSNDVVHSQDANFNFQGRKVLITGASRGIGRSIALGFAASGASLILHAKSHSEALEQVATSASQYGGSVEKWIYDLSNSHNLKQALETLKADVDILVLNASVEIRNDILKFNLGDLQQQFSCNFLSNIMLLQHVLPAMRAKHWGRIIGLGSIQETHPNPDLAVYASLKTAQTHYLKTIAGQVAEYNITVNTVAPGVILTDRNREILSDNTVRQQVEAKIPMARIGNPQDCVGSVLFLASEYAQYITGAWLPVDGGFHVT